MGDAGDRRVRRPGRVPGLLAPWHAGLALRRPSLREHVCGCRSACDHTYDLPGYGGSRRFRGRRLVDCVADVSAIADSLGVERFAVTAGSCGGPHSLAVAARLPEQVTRAACVAGVAPFDTPDFEWSADMDAVNIEELGRAQEGEDVLAREIERVAAGMLERVANDPSQPISDEVQLSEADRALMAKPVLVPPQHGKWLAQDVPNADAVIDEQGGHLPDPIRVSERFGWLVQAV